MADDANRWTVVMICLNVEGETQEAAFDNAYGQIADDSADLVCVEPQTVTWEVNKS